MLMVDLDANSRIDFNCRIEHKEMGENKHWENMDMEIEMLEIIFL